MKLKLKRLLYSNWLICGIITLVILAGMLFEFYPMQFLEYKTYDILASLKQRKDPNPIVIVGIDQKSIKNIGSWPWPRTYIADMVQRLSEYKPKVMGICLLYPSRDLNPGLNEIKDVRQAIRKDSFLKNLEKIGLISLAAKQTGVDRHTIAKWRQNDPDFDLKCTEIEAIYTDNLVKKLEHQAFDEKDNPPNYAQARLQEFLLKSRDYS